MNNEITLKVKGSMEDFCKTLESKGFISIEKFLLHDRYFIPKNLNLKNLSLREILSYAILLRKIVEYNPYKEIYKFTFKNKDINENRRNIITKKF